MLFDSHAHLDDERFDEDRDEVIKKIKSENVKYVLNAGADIASSKRSIHLSEKYDFIYASVGVHPHDVKDMNEDTINLLKTLSKHEKVVAIGEIGLDYYYENSPREIQKRWFERQIQLANEVKLPIIVHDRDAHKDTFDIIKTTKSKDIGCVLHCYSGSLELAKEYVKMGCFISIAGPVTFKNNVKTVEVIKKIPLEYLLIETDCPYLAPHPHRGKRNDPSYVRYIAEKIAIEKGISYEKVCEITTKNAKILFNI
ncbi:TatD DNase family protein [Alkalithermobacter thermoalcaliphilus JW-YL-7 = DSM 7308]|uniref:Hydrolase, TatD family n=1 Tax=Alkalithermobacter thermoalcaliphilus JW-YL-7 = DSM 7308 TaxID=1121328 RepID=A0A150FSN6_CLOPD|nr:hydrolase, TatD family [[Clostridium] paradoxum JW-YL-7 = DSM 7308]SHL19511.1 TatD DNase family protein [[Clostridium] paradoxum JW-YL-7 = DSM 7308]